MAQSLSSTPVAAMDVHVTGRRVLATIVDGIVLGVLFSVMSMLFGSSSASGTSVSFSMGTFPTLGFFVLAMAYYILIRGLSWPDLRQDAPWNKGGAGGQWRGAGDRSSSYKERAAHRGWTLGLSGCLRYRSDLGEEPAPGRHGSPHPGRA